MLAAVYLMCEAHMFMPQPRSNLTGLDSLSCDCVRSYLRYRQNCGKNRTCQASLMETLKEVCATDKIGPSGTFQIYMGKKKTYSSSSQIRTNRTDFSMLHVQPCYPVSWETVVSQSLWTEDPKAGNGRKIWWNTFIYHPERGEREERNLRTV